MMRTMKGGWGRQAGRSGNRVLPYLTLRVCIRYESTEMYLRDGSRALVVVFRMLSDCNGADSHVPCQGT